MNQCYKNEDLMGIKVNPLTIDDLNSIILENLKRDGKIIIANHNLHSIYLFHKADHVKEFYGKADYIHVDGMMLVKWGKYIGKSIREDHRVTYVDWIEPLMRDCVRYGWSVFFVGGREKTGMKAADVLRNCYPGLDITTASGYFEFGSTEEKSLVDDINRRKPNILMVGMGMPRQELWISRFIEQLEVNVVLPAGACMDYVAGEVPTPPRWMGRAGLEWLYRLNVEPSRLARRYLLEPWALLPWMMRDLRSRKKPQAN